MTATVASLGACAGDGPPKATRGGRRQPRQRSGAQDQPPQPATQADPLRPLRDLLRSPDGVAAVEATVKNATGGIARRWLPKTLAARSLTVQAVREVVTLAVDGVPAAQALVSTLPIVLLPKGSSIEEAIRSLTSGSKLVVDRPSDGADDWNAYISRLRAALTTRN